MIRIRFFGPGELIQKGLGTAVFALSSDIQMSFFLSDTCPVAIKGLCEQVAKVPQQDILDPCSSHASIFKTPDPIHCSCRSCPTRFSISSTLGPLFARPRFVLPRAMIQRGDSLLCILQVSSIAGAVVQMAGPPNIEDWVQELMQTGDEEERCE